jgi:hypothetical protein
VTGAIPVGRTMPTKRPPPVPRRDDAHVGGILDDIGDAFQAGGKYIYDHGDTIADIAETVVSVAYPAAAPIAAAEHKLRTGIEMNMKEAKDATKAATAIGQAVKEHVADKAAAGDPEAAAALAAAPSSPTRSRSSSAQYQLAVDKSEPSSSSSSGLLLVAGLGLLLLLAGEL